MDVSAHSGLSDIQRATMPVRMPLVAGSKHSFQFESVLEKWGLGLAMNELDDSQVDSFAQEEGMSILIASFDGTNQIISGFG